MALINDLTTDWSDAVTALSTDELWQVQGDGVVEVENDGSGHGTRLVAVAAQPPRNDAFVLPAGATPKYKLVWGDCTIKTTPV